MRYINLYIVVHRYNILHLLILRHASCYLRYVLETVFFLKNESVFI